VMYLRRKLDERDEEVRRLTITLAQAVARLPQLPAPEPPGAEPPTPPAPPGETHPTPPPEPVARRSWWQRLWG
jgi:hypothetical protein